MPHRVSLVLTISLLIVPSGKGDDWPTYAHDNQRSGVTSESLQPPFSLAWVHRAAIAPRPAWPDPARHDYWHQKFDLRPRVTYDRADQPVVVGSSLFYASSADDTVVCLDATSGDVQWRFWAEAPIRLAPTVDRSRVYVGSDDGRVYCLSANTGHLLWRYEALPEPRRCVGNGRIISRSPVRSGVLIEDGTAFFAAGLFPESEGVFLCALDAVTGEEVYRRAINCSAQGYLSALDDRLMVPTGRTAPVIFSRDGARRLRDIPSAGGSFAIVANDIVAAGSGDGSGELAVTDKQSLHQMVSFHGVHLLAAGGRCFIHAENELAALDWSRFAGPVRELNAIKPRRYRLLKSGNAKDGEEAKRLQTRIEQIEAELKTCWLWRVDCNEPYAAIMAGNTLFTGGDGTVSAYRADDGEKVWTAQVQGQAYGLAAANGRLLVSTSTGQLYAFVESKAESQAVMDGPPRQVPDRSTTETARADQEQLAERLVSVAGTDQGFCLLLSPTPEALVRALTRKSRFRIICLVPDSQQAQWLRSRLGTGGDYGSRAVVHQGSAKTLREYPRYFANLIVWDTAWDGGKQLEIAKALRRVLRPCGGTLIDVTNITEDHARRANGPPWIDLFSSGEFKSERFAEPPLRAWVRRGALPGSGEWTHGLADPENTACSGDQRVSGPLEILWFGEPGPRPMADRHHRNVVPLYGDGRLFVPGDNLVIAVDAYNGTILWQRKIENSLRLGAFLDCNNMVLDDECLNVVAEDTCFRLDVASGKERCRLRMPQPADSHRLHWGYLATADGLLIGSGRKPQAAYREQSREADNRLWYDNMSLVTSESLFAMVPGTGEVTWEYRSGVLLNTTLTTGDGKVFFVESHSPGALANGLGRMPMATFLAGPNFLVALDLRSGKVAWRREINLENCRLIAYLSYAEGKLILSGNKYIDRKLWYFCYGIDPATGAAVWEQSHNSGYSPGGGHGEQNRHPTIVNGKVYLYPVAYQLDTGRAVDGWRFSRQGHGCGNISASLYAMFWRGGNPWRRDLTPGAKAAPINRVTRPGCWINIIPAGGLVMIPEASSGCTCAYPLQTSLTYLPRETP